MMFNHHMIFIYILILYISNEMIDVEENDVRFFKSKVKYEQGCIVKFRSEVFYLNKCSKKY